MPTIRRYIPLVLIGLISACINLPEIDSSPPDSGTSTPLPDAGAGDPDAGTQLSIAITAPTGTVYTSGEVAISVTLQGGTPERVQLFKGPVELATLSPPYTYTWNTVAEPEGSYTLTARATRSGRTFSSEPVTIIVDRTNLQVASRSPMPGATNVDYSRPIQVVFSKPVQARTVSDTTVSFAVAGVLAEKTLSLSSDGKTLTITPKTKPPLPTTVSIGLSSGILDSAGNALVVPSTPWNFELPQWYALGGPLHAVGGNTLLKDTAMVLDSQSNPVVAWSEQLTAGGRASIFVYRWDGNAFKAIGGALNGTPNGSAYKPALALDGSGNPVVAWQESDGFNENIYVKRWTGTSWQSVGEGVLSAQNDTRSSPVPTPARNPTLAVRTDEIHVAWEEKNVDGISGIYVRKSVGGGAFIGAGHGGGLVDAVSKQTSGIKPSLVLDSNGQPIVAFQEETLEQYSPTNIYVMRLKPDGYWEYAVPPFYGDDVNGYVSGGLSAFGGNTPATDCSLSIDAQNNLYLAWMEASYSDRAGDLQVFRSTGPQSWEQVGGALSAYGAGTSAEQARVQVTPAGKLFVTWNEFDGYAEGYYHLFASHWDNQSWNSLTTMNGINQGPKSGLRPVLAVDSSGRPVVAWYEGYGYDLAGDYVYVRRYNN
jgi:hypothetical protein